mgnify:CR=1
MVNLIYSTPYTELITRISQKIDFKIETHKNLNTVSDQITDTKVEMKIDGALLFSAFFS